MCCNNCFDHYHIKKTVIGCCHTNNYAAEATNYTLQYGRGYIYNKVL